MKVLLVDDEIEFVNALSNRLRVRGIQTEVVYDGGQALEYVKKQEPDVIVLDLKIPGLHGMEVLRRPSKTNVIAPALLDWVIREVLRRLSKINPDIQVVILTGPGTECHKKGTSGLKRLNCLRKPTDIETLADRIRGTYRYKMETVMAAAAFAEAGEFETARHIAKEAEPFQTASEMFKERGK